LSRDFLPSSYPDLIINPNGNVGIGTSSPNGKLDIQYDMDVDTGGITTLSSGIAQYGNINFSGVAAQASGSTGTTMQGLTWQVNNYSGTTDYGVQAQLVVGNNGSIGTFMGFFTSANYGAAPNERLRIASGGNVGIGTDSPNAKLFIQYPDATTNTVLRTKLDAAYSMGISNEWVSTYVSKLQLGRVGIGNASNMDFIYDIAGTEYGSIKRNYTASSLKFERGTTVDMTNSSGYNTLSISGTTGAQIAFQTSGVGKHYIYSTATDFNIYNGQAGNLKLYTNSNLKMSISSSGELIQGNNTNGIIPGTSLLRLANTGIYGGAGAGPYGTYGGIIFNSTTNYTGGAKRYMITNGYLGTSLAFIRSADASTDPSISGDGGTVSSGSVSYYIAGSGDNIFLENVGIGYTSPGYSLEIATSGSAGKLECMLMEMEQYIQQMEMFSFGQIIQLMQ
jgi:hypothetical protein